MKVCREICNTIAIISLLIFIVLIMASDHEFIVCMRIVFAGLAALAYGVRLGIEIANDEKIGVSLGLIAICILNVFLSATELAM